MPICNIFLIALILFCPLLASSKIIEINNLQQVNKDYSELGKDYSGKDILVVLAVKNVIFKPFFPSLKQLNKSEIEQLKKTFNLVKPSKIIYFDTISQLEYKNELLDPTVPQIIQEIQGNGSPVIAFDNGLTGSFNNIKVLEKWKADYLKSFNINLSTSFPSSEYLIFNNLEAFENTYPTFYQGVLSSNNSSIFQLILSFLIEVKYTPKVMIMVSNLLTELTRVEEQLKNYDENVGFIGYHLVETSKPMINGGDFIKTVNELAKKLTLVKRNNPPIKNKVKNKVNTNPYEYKK